MDRNFALYFSLSHPNPLNVRLRKFLYRENLIFNLNIYYEEDLLFDDDGAYWHHFI